jgi:hypothetical protein
MRLQLCFRPHINQRFVHKVIGPQNCGSLNFWNFGSPETKCHFDVGLVERYKVYYKEEGGGFPQVRGRGESCEYEFARGLS